MKKLTALLCVLALCLSMAGCSFSLKPSPKEDKIDTTPVEESFSGGAGTEADPYLMSSAGDMLRLAEIVNGRAENRDSYSNGCYLMQNDIDLGSENWVPIGWELGFGGVFNGGGNRITGLKMDYSDENAGDIRCFGLFGRVTGGTVSDLTVAESEINIRAGSSPETGAVAGSVQGYILSCRVEDSVSVSGSYTTGGICGCIGHGEDEAPEPVSGISGCTNAAAVKANDAIGNIGGIAGWIGCDVSECENTGDITSNSEAGGIAAVIRGNVESCRSSGRIKGIQAGGICYLFEGKGSGGSDTRTERFIRNCENTGEITATKRDGAGICADMAGGNIEQCRNSGNITAEKGYAAGIAAVLTDPAPIPGSEPRRIADCENSGTINTVSRTNPSGGICAVVFGEENGADVSESISFVNCTNSGEVRGSSFSGGICGSFSVNADGKILAFDGCTNSAPIFGSKGVGGMVGRVIASSETQPISFVVNFANCRNSGELNDSSLHSGCLGGMAGEVAALKNANVMPVLQKCSNTGKMISPDSETARSNDDIGYYHFGEESTDETT